MGGKFDNVPGCNYHMEHGKTIDILDGNMKMKFLHTPCHTRGHFMVYLEAAGCQDEETHQSEMINGYKMVRNVNRCVFTGDTVFIGGCGMFFEGSAK